MVAQGLGLPAVLREPTFQPFRIAESRGRRSLACRDSPGGGRHLLYFSFSSSILMRRDLRNFKSWSLILNSGLVERVVTRDVLSEDFSPCLLTPMVASRTRKMS